ncbi:MAG: hypothetical protein HQ567_13915 [Candidatus Nealsonbacteria bacterium]|nr:hypothetical protein [Candidatus Nealsonbacteria bacterium]
MAEVWLLDYQRFNEMNSVSPVDACTIERTLGRLDGAETFCCGLTNVTDHSWLACRGDPDNYIIEYVSGPLENVSNPETVGCCIFFLARKSPPDRRALRIRWQSNPDVFVDVRADSVLNLREAIAIFTTFFNSKTVHQDFTTVPKPLNGYLA